MDIIRSVARNIELDEATIEELYGERVLTMVQAQRALDEMGEGSFENWMGTGGGSVSSREE